MKTLLLKHRGGLITAIAWLLFQTVPLHAAITVLGYWRMGESDASVTAGIAATNTIDSVGFNNLKINGQAFYSNDVAIAALVHTASSRSINFAGSAFASNSIVTAATDNFGIEAWVKPNSVSAGQIIAYSGSTATGGWGIMISGSNYLALFGGRDIWGTGVATPNVWTHVALVRSGGVATVYTNGIAAGTSLTAPNVPVGNFAIAAPPQSPTDQFLTGLVDEVRVFTFAAGQFSTNELLFNHTHNLNTTNLVEGPGAGTDGIVLTVNPAINPWTATANATWLHLAATNGASSTNVIFNFDANPGATRTGTISIAEQTLTVTQAGATYVAAAPVSLVTTGLNQPYGLALDSAGNVYIADAFNFAIKKWTVTNNTVTTLTSLGVNHFPYGVAVDHTGNVYITVENYATLVKWTAANSNLTTLASPPQISSALGVAVDGTGNLYVADGMSAIQEWKVADQSVSNLITGLNTPYGVAVDGAGGVYIADTGNSAIKKWTAASNTVSDLISSGLNHPEGVAVDQAGNVFIADYANHAVEEWPVALGTLNTLVPSGLYYPRGVTVDGAGNVYIADSGNNALKRLAHAFVDTTSKLESADAISDLLPPVLPATASLAGPFAPTSDQPWLTIDGVDSGVVHFTIAANTNFNARVAHIALLGQSVSVMQAPPAFSLGAANRLEGPNAGADSVVLSVKPQIYSWVATENADWLHLVTPDGDASMNVIFSFDANPGNTRTGTLTIAGLTLTITQAGSNYVAAPAPVTQIYGGVQSFGMAADGAGNIYVTSGQQGTVLELMPTTGTWTALIGSTYTRGVAVDAAGNVYLAAPDANAILKWTRTNNQQSTLLSSGLSGPYGVAVDDAGNVYVADSDHNVVKKWIVANNTMTTLVTGLSDPFSVAVDKAGNVYIADTFHNRILERRASDGAVFGLPFGSLFYPSSVSVDGAGNVYVADIGSGAIKKWAPADGSLTVLADGLYAPNAAVADGTGNLFFADTFNFLIKELPAIFVDPSARSEPAAAGNDSLPVVLPVTENLLPPFAPTSDQLWLTIDGVTNGIVSFSFSVNPGPARTANISILGQLIPVTQAGATVTPPTLANSMVLDDGTFQFSFSNTQSTAFTVLSTTNLSLPLDEWTVIGAPSNVAPGLFQFTSESISNEPQRFYRIRSP
jgi:streptogramin lyase